MSNHILLTGRVNNANPVSSHHTIGLPSLTAFHGFLYSFLIDSKVDVKAMETFWVGLSNVHLREGNLRLTNTAKSSQVDKILSPPINELSRSLDFDFAIIVELKKGIQINKSYFSDVLKKKRIAGGDIFSSKVEVADDTGFVGLLKKVSPKTLFLKDATFVLHQDFFDEDEDEYEYEYEDESEDEKMIAFSNMSPLERMVYLIRKERNNKNKEYNGWYTPISVGYKLLEDPTSKRSDLIRGVKNHLGEFVRYDHAYAEPVLGVVTTVRKNKLIQLLTKEGDEADEYGLKSAFNKETNQFLILNKKYNLNSGEEE